MTKKSKAPILAKGTDGAAKQAHLKNGRRFVWVELIKAIALIWIFVNHIIERMFGNTYIANPFAGWPAFGERLAQLRPLPGFGLWDVPLVSQDDNFVQTQHLDYFLVGEFARVVDLYPVDLLSTPYSLVTSIGGYELYALGE